ncbi:MAG TPA: radical SAM protein [Methanomassiliicoccales archaeon]|jgi:DNA repair photolyase
MITRDLDFFMMEDKMPPPMVKAYEVRATTALPKSNLPGLDYALNPYVGCEHDCIYCFAPDVLHKDPSKWGKEVGVRSNLPVLLAKEIKNKRGVIGIGTVTDPYQPLEKSCLLTRKCLMEIIRHDNPISILTKSDLVVRDIELIESTKRPEVGVTITSVDDRVSHAFEPGAPPPSQRLEALRKLTEAGLNTYAMVGPVLPMLCETDIIDLVKAIANTGTKRLMMDRMRFRPGIDVAIANLPLMGIEPFHAWYQVALADRTRALALERIITNACNEFSLCTEQAFRS